MMHGLVTGKCIIFPSLYIYTLFVQYMNVGTHIPLIECTQTCLGHHEGWIVAPSSNTDKKENKIFLIYKEIQNGAVGKSYMRKGFLIYEEMGINLAIYEEAVSHIWLCNCSIVDFLIYEENLIFFFYQWIGSSKSTIFWEKDKKENSRKRKERLQVKHRGIKYTERPTIV